MPTAKLLSREIITNQSLTSIVEKSQSKKPPHQDYDLHLTSSQLDIIPISRPNQYIKSISSDEGFESDIDTVSIISSDDSFASSTCLVEDHVLKHRENDSANGSASSDSDTELPPKRLNNESYPLPDVLCYTDVKFPKVLVFCIKDSVLVFNFENVEHLQQFYTSFNTLKAVTNQRTYGKNIGTKFNLLHRTDHNGVTHIEISREPNATKLLLLPNETEANSNIISINTPDNAKIEKKSTLLKIPDTKKSETLRFVREKTIKPELKPQKSLDDSKLNLNTELKTSKSEFFPSNNGIHSYTLRAKNQIESLKLDTLVVENQRKDDTALKKVWKSAEDLLDTPKRPERKRKPKGKAPPPPVQDQKQNVMKGQFVRVSVDPKRPIEKPIRTEENLPNFQTFSSSIQTFTPHWSPLRQTQTPMVLTTKQEKPKIPEYSKKPNVLRKPDMTLQRNVPSWTNSVPRLLKKPRSRSECRNQTPMAYRYIDTTRPQIPTYNTNSATISNRLFGLSQKLKEFSTNVVQPNSKSFSYCETDCRRNSIGEMTYKNSNESSLKSVIKKEDGKRGRQGNEKKVTFSAYATVQVV